MSNSSKTADRYDLVNLSNSILKAYQIDTYHASIEWLDQLLPHYRNIVLMVLDGLGSDHLEHLAHDHLVNQAKVSDLWSVFPPTTTAATTSLLTARYPIEHGWLGWSLPFSSLGVSLELYTGCNDYDGKTFISRQPMEEQLHYTTIIELINQLTSVKADIVSPYGNLYVDDWEDQLEVIVKCTQRPGKNFIYTYYDEPDHSMHRLGVKHYKTVSTIHHLADDIANLINQLKDDTLLLITADHGHLDVQPVDLTNDHQLIRMLKIMPTMEARAINFHVKSEHHTAFSSYFTNHYPSYQLLDHQSVLDQQWFGPGKQHTTISDTLGDYLAVATTAETLFFRTREFESSKGAHAGGMAQESTVPLIILTGKIAQGD
jgi:predicted AlkP superfamily pyrophosphatase or phosphodiesterase